MAHAEGQSLVSIEKGPESTYEQAQYELSEHVLRRHSLLVRLCQLTQSWLKGDMATDDLLRMDCAAAEQILMEMAAEGEDINDSIAKVNHWGALCGQQPVEWRSLRKP